MSLFRHRGGQEGPSARSSLHLQLPAVCSKTAADQPSRGSQPSWWKPDQAEHLRARAPDRMESLRQVRPCWETKAEHLRSRRAAQLRAPEPTLSNASGAISWIRCSPKPCCEHQPVAWPPCFDCLFPTEEQSAELDVGFRGRAANRFSVMSGSAWRAIAQTGQWQQILPFKSWGGGGGGKIPPRGPPPGGGGPKARAGDTSNHPPLRRVSEGLEPQMPTLGQCSKHGFAELWLDQSPRQASLLLPYFDFVQDRRHGRPCRSPQTFSSIQMPPCSTCAVGTLLRSCLPDRQRQSKPAMLQHRRRSKANAAHLWSFCWRAGYVP